jgi:hypothetical protein
MQTRSVLSEDLAAAPLIPVHVQCAELQSLPQRIAKVLLIQIRSPEEGHDHLLVDVLELLCAQTPALREATGDSQLAGPPFPENLPDPLRGKLRLDAWPYSERHRPSLYAVGLAAL